MRPIRVGAATLNQTPLDWTGNERRIIEALSLARERGVSLLCLPELCITGYGCEDAFLAPNVHETSLAILQELLPHTRGLVTCFGLPLVARKAVFNTCCLVVDGTVLGFVGKRILAGDGIHYEPRWFKPWPKGKRTTIHCLGQEYQLGDFVFDVGGLRIGFEICEDAWAAERPAADPALQSADFILNPSASHFAFGKHAVRRRLVEEGSRAFGVNYLYANLLGNEAGRIIYDGDTFIAHGGRVIAESQRFSFEEMQLIDAVVDVDLSRVRQSSVWSYQPNFDMDDREFCISSEYRLPAASPLAPSAATATWEASSTLKHEEFTRSLCLGLFDYMRKSRSRGFVVSLSGGADSSAICCLIAMMVRLAIAELGIDRFAARLQPIIGTNVPADERGWVQTLLTTVYQSTRNSSDVTRDAASVLAKALGSRHLAVDVDTLVQAYQELVSTSLGRRLDWKHDDLALQNIQARARAPGVWMIANVTGALLLATSNRSEAAVGYATMDGDTAGGLSPIAGIDKAFIRRWLTWVCEEGPMGVGNIPELSVVTSQAPTAELRPAEDGQTDERDLMPYDVLDSIERAAIRDKRSPRETLILMRERFKEYEALQLAMWVERFFRLWARNQWKRERYAPSFHVDDANLDPKTWCRFPILSGGFERELQELWAYLRATQPNLGG
jgi:NAD+ synthase (glutamine-hydrolysing)